MICNLDSAADIVRALTDAVAQHAKDRVILLREPTDLAKADKVLLVLTHGVLSGDSLTQLKDTIRQDTQRQDTQRQDRVVAVYSEEFGWSFGCAEQESASPEVRACIDNHEAIVYRDRKDGSAQHEFMAMFNHLLIQLGAVPANGSMQTASPTDPWVFAARSPTSDAASGEIDDTLSPEEADGQEQGPTSFLLWRRWRLVSAWLLVTRGASLGLLWVLLRRLLKRFLLRKV